MRFIIGILVGTYFLFNVSKTKDINCIWIYSWNSKRQNLPKLDSFVNCFRRSLKQITKKLMKDINQFLGITTYHIKQSFRTECNVYFLKKKNNINNNAPHSFSHVTQSRLWFFSTQWKRNSPLFEVLTEDLIFFSQCDSNRIVHYL